MPSPSSSSLTQVKKALTKHKTSSASNASIVWLLQDARNWIYYKALKQFCLVDNQWLLCLYCVLQLQMESKHWTANRLGKDFKYCRNADKFPNKVWASLRLGRVPAAKDPNKLIQPCSPISVLSRYIMSLSKNVAHKYIFNRKYFFW